MKNPYISVIMHAYNHGKYVAEAINSVLNQTFTDFELIISDDGSSDNTAQVIRSFTDERIKAFFFDKHVGQKLNFDNCCKYVSGKYIAILASDDYWDVTKLEKQIEYIESHSNIGAVFSCANIIDEDGRLTDKNEALSYVFSKPWTYNEIIENFFYKGNCLCAISFFALSDIALPTLRSSRFLRQLGDFESWIALAKKTRFAVIPEKLVYHRVRDNNQNMSAATSENLLRNNNEMAIILRDFFTDMPDSLFYEVFSDKLIKRGKLSRNEILCEQALLYLTLDSYISTGKMLAAEKLHRISQDPVCFSVLINDYGYNPEDIARLLIEYNLIEAEQYQCIADSLMEKESQYQDIINSRIWKATKPLRVMRDGLKKIIAKTSVDYS